MVKNDQLLEGYGIPGFDRGQTQGGVCFLGCTNLGIKPRSRAFWLKKMGLLNLVKKVLRADGMSFLQQWRPVDQGEDEG